MDRRMAWGERMRWPHWWLAAWVAVLLVGAAGPAAAHPADEYFLLHLLNVTPTGARLELYLFPGPLVAPTVWDAHDRDGDGAIDPDEARAFVETLAGQLSLTLDDQAVPLTLVAAGFPDDRQSLMIGNGGIWGTFEARWDAPLGATHRLVLRNTNFIENGIADYRLTLDPGLVTTQAGTETDAYVAEIAPAGSALPSATPTPTVPPAPATPRLIVLPTATVAAAIAPPLPSASPTPSPAPLSAAINTPEALPAGGESAEAAALARQARSPWLQRLEALLLAPELTPTFYLLALLAALVLGALHALTPGHGKAIVAAYLVGSRGTLAHAAFLGGIVTVTHTGSVVALGLLVLLASQLIVPERLGPALEGVSGLLIVLLGLGLLWQRRRPEAAEHLHAGGEVLHRHGTAGAHSHGAEQRQPGWGGLVALGVSGGLVPCPDAIAILLMAVAMQRLFLGLLLIVAFSAGLAVILIGLGMLFVLSRGMLARHLTRFDAVARWLPLGSALAVTLLGVVVLARAVVALL